MQRKWKLQTELLIHGASCGIQWERMQLQEFKLLFCLKIFFFRIWVLWECPRPLLATKKSWKTLVINLEVFNCKNYFTPPKIWKFMLWVQRIGKSGDNSQALKWILHITEGHWLILLDTPFAAVVQRSHIKGKKIISQLSSWSPEV